MNGVEILSQAEVATSTAFNWTAFWVSIGVTFLFGFICVLIYQFKDYGCVDWSDVGEGIVFGSLMGCFGAIIGLGLGFGLSKPTEFETQYKVIISDEVSMNEFLEQYEIIDQEGKIYTVREKE